MDQALALTLRGWPPVSIGKTLPEQKKENSSAPQISCCESTRRVLPKIIFESDLNIGLFKRHAILTIITTNYIPPTAQKNKQILVPSTVLLLLTPKTISEVQYYWCEINFGQKSQCGVRQHGMGLTTNRHKITCYFIFRTLNEENKRYLRLKSCLTAEDWLTVWNSWYVVLTFK